VLAHVNPGDSSLENSTESSGDLKFKKSFGQVRYSNTTYGYNDLSLSAKQSAWWSSGADAFIMPVVSKSNQFY